MGLCCTVLSEENVVLKFFPSFHVMFIVAADNLSTEELRRKLLYVSVWKVGPSFLGQMTSQDVKPGLDKVDGRMRFK